MTNISFEESICLISDDLIPRNAGSSGSDEGSQTSVGVKSVTIEPSSGASGLNAVGKSFSVLTLKLV